MSTEDRIRELCARVVSERDETAARQTMEELQSALAEYIQSLRLKTARVVDKIYARPPEP